MGRRILIFEKDPDYAERLKSAFRRDEVVMVNIELAAIRELSSGFFDLFIAGIRANRAREGIRLVQILTAERKIPTVAPIVVLSDGQDPAFVRSLVETGISDYILYADDPKVLRPRIEAVLAKSGGIGNMLIRVATAFLGPAAGIFLERQARDHLHLNSLKELRREQLPEFLCFLTQVARPILEGKAVHFARRLEQVFRVGQQT